MSRKNTFGDQLTLFATANLYNIDIQIVSTLGAGAQHVFHPSSSSPLATVYLGHFAENLEENYVSLIPEFNNDTSTSNDYTGHADVDVRGVNDDVGNVNSLMLIMTQVTFTMMQVTLTIIQLMLTMAHVTFTIIQVTIMMTQMMFTMTQVSLTVM